MSEEENNKSLVKEARNIKKSNKNKQYKFLGFLLVIFVVFFVYSHSRRKAEKVNWIEDYETGIKMAKELDKPALLAFYKVNTTLTNDMWRNTYTKSEVINYVERNFVPVFIDVDKNPELAQKYGINYYPTHYIKYPDREEIKGPLMGYDPPGPFIQKTQELLKEMGRVVIQ
ncbi:MAG: DUF255 domain-containing protein [Planctomycetota bacterium]|jgi:thioredoxin-related protein